MLEFGSNWGRNLKAIKKNIPHIEAVGIDINADAVALGQKRGFDIRHGNVHALSKMHDNSFDVVFTVSVLDHIPDPKAALQELIRISRSKVVLLEPWFGHEGKIVQGPHRETGELEDIEPYAYSWNY